MTIRYRAFSTFRPATAAEFLFGLRVNGAGSRDWSFSQTPEGWALQAAGHKGAVVAEGEMLRYREGGALT